MRSLILFEIISVVNIAFNLSLFHEVFKTVQAHRGGSGNWKRPLREEIVYVANVGACAPLTCLANMYA